MLIDLRRLSQMDAHETEPDLLALLRETLSTRFPCQPIAVARSYSQFLIRTDDTQLAVGIARHNPTIVIVYKPVTSAIAEGELSDSAAKIGVHVLDLIGVMTSSARGTTATSIDLTEPDSIDRLVTLIASGGLGLS